MINDFKRVSTVFSAALASLMPTYSQAYHGTKKLAEEYAENLTPASLKLIHAEVMASSRFQPNLGDHEVDQPDPRDWKYVNIGRSRTETFMKLELKPNADVVQKTCPHSEVDSELLYLCGQAKVCQQC
jgi:hypothetical protein